MIKLNTKKFRKYIKKFNEIPDKKLFSKLDKMFQQLGQTIHDEK